MLQRFTRWLALAVLVAVASTVATPATADIISADARSALTAILPPGYRTAAVIPSALGEHDKGHLVAVLVDTETDRPERVVRLLHLAWNGRWSVLDNVAIAGRDATLLPQYLSGVSVVKVGAQNLLYVYTTWSGGGSGGMHYFQFFKAVGTRLQLVRGFEHVRMEHGFFTLHNDRIYDADIVCTRGEKKGRGYVYACHLDAKEYSFDGEHLVETRRERMEERTGNRFLSETYRNLSLHAEIMRGGHFPNSN